MLKNSTTWRIAAVTSFLFAATVAAQEPVVHVETGGSLRAGETFTPEVDIVWRSEARFAKLLEDALQREPLESALKARIEETAQLRLELVEKDIQIRSLIAALEAAERESSAWRLLSASLEGAFEGANEALEREQARTRPLLSHGVQVGVGLLWDGEEKDFGGYVGYGVNFDIAGR